MSAWNHFRTITHHKWLVLKYCWRVGLYRQGLMHDLSKFSWTEFSRGAKYWQGNRSPNNAEREDTGLSLAWLHHKGRNKHHFEYWVDYDPSAPRGLTGMPMPRKYVAEMVMDRISASKTYRGKDYKDSDPYEYYLKGAGKIWFIHEETNRQLGYILKILNDQGEKAMISYVKNVFLKNRD